MNIQTNIKSFRSFGSDNYSGVHPEVMQALIDANNGQTMAYGGDDYTKLAIELFKKAFGEQVDVYFVFNGTGANVVALSTLTNSYGAIVCAETAHINVHECGATENFTGAKLLLVPSGDGKITVNDIKKYLSNRGSQHCVQPRVIAITQATEYGTVYTLDEIKTLADFAHASDLLIYMDGARIANAAAYLNVPLSAFVEAGVDALSFGGTKNGMMFGEAIIFCNPALSKNTKYVRDQAMQLASKMRFLSAQFIAMLTDDLWLKNAHHANKMAQLLAAELIQINGIELAQAIQINSIFLRMPTKYIPLLQAYSFFHVWDADKSIVRLMTAWNTTELEIKEFVEHAKNLVGNLKQCNSGA